MTYIVTVRKKNLKDLLKLPFLVQQKFKALLKVLTESGTNGAVKWQNFSKLGANEYHCHLTHHYVACWRHEKKTITIEVYYVGSREDAPY
jgi:mRNA-degrading endonuclease RelE of RelBE toxin-antitoxin system